MMRCIYWSEQYCSLVDTIMIRIIMISILISIDTDQFLPQASICLSVCTDAILICYY